MVAFIIDRRLIELRDDLNSEPSRRIQPGYVWHVERDGLVGKRVFNNGSILEFVINPTDDGGFHGEFRSFGVDLTNIHNYWVMRLYSHHGAGAVWSFLEDVEGGYFANLSG